MKRFFWFPLAVFAAMTVASCQEETDLPSPGEEYILTATIDSDSAVRTSLSPSTEGISRVFWSAGDRIGIYADGATVPALFRLVSGEGERDAQFSGPVQGVRYLAFYPWSNAGKADKESISITLPQEQEYVADTFAPDSYPMIASGTAAGLSFRNLCSILRISMTGHQAVTALEFLPSDPAAVVSGPATARLVDGTPQLTMSADGNNRVVLNVPGVVLREDTATDFYLVLPPATYKGGFTVRVHTSGGSMDKVCGEDFTMERSKLHKAAPFVLKLDQGVEPSLQLTGSGTVEEPFLVGSLSDLLLMQAAVNTVDGTLAAADGTAVTAKSAHYRLTSDIDLSPVCGADSGKSWTPVGGTEDTPFFGVFDGDGHTITNLYIRRAADNQGLFGFGYDYPNYYVKGMIKKLTVRGYVEGGSQVGLVVGVGGAVSYCTGEGEVVSDNEATGGIAGSVFEADHCVNKASVRKTRGMTYSIGGIAGVVVNLCHDCQNEGEIYSEEGYEIGGIAGVTRNAVVYNCINSGLVFGGQQCGGIVGLLSGSVQNCFNEGDVSARSGYSGGIVGVMEPSASMMNCVSIGAVTERIFGTANAGICGFVKTDGSIDYGYWPGDIPAVRGSMSDDTYLCQSFSPRQWTENESGSIFFITEEGFPCTSLVDALNGWAYEHSTEDMPLSGWTWLAETGTGTLTGKPANNPAGENGFFKVIPSSRETGPAGGTMDFRVASSSDFRIATAPSWIHPAEKMLFGEIRNNWLQTVSVDANPGDHRTGTLELRNDKGETLVVTISQFGPNEFDWSQPFYHRSLFFVYAAPLDFLAYGSYEDAYDIAEKEIPGRILHAGIFNEGPLACPQYARMCEINGIDGTPKLIMDGTTYLNNGSIEGAAQGIIDTYRLNESRETFSTAEVSVTLDGRHLTLDIFGRFKRKGDYTIHVMLLEDGLSYYDDTWNHVVRMVLSNEAGDPFTLKENQSVLSFIYSADIPETYDLDKMSALVFIQTPVTSSVSRVDNAFAVTLK
jgi:hypothetical protein